VLGLTLTPKSLSAMAILAGVGRDHFRPVMGSPAVSYSSRNSIRVTMSAFFFHGLASAARVAGGCQRHLLIEPLLASAGDGVRIQGEEFGHDTVAAVPQFDGFQAGEQATLLLVEQTVEEQNSGLEFFGRYLQSGSIGHQRNRLCRFPGAELISSLATFDGSVQEASAHLRATQTSRAHQIV